MCINYKMLKLEKIKFKYGVFLSLQEKGEF